MTLTYGRSPFGPDRGSYNIAVPDQVAYAEPWPRRMRAMFAGRTVVDSRRGVMVHRTGAAPIVLFPLEDVTADTIWPDEPPGSWTVQAGGRSAPHAITLAPAIGGQAGADTGGLVLIDYGAMDRWFEEDDPVYAHLRDPYHRVDVRSSSQHILVRRDGVVVAESSRPKLLFETGLPVRYYLPFADVRTDWLTLSRTISQCPYKSDGHWNLRSADGTVEAVADAARSLPHPLAEATLALEHISFYPGKLDVTVDGERVRA